MLQTWTLTGPSPSRRLGLDSVAALLDAAQASAPAGAMLAALQRIAKADYLALVRYDDGTPSLVDSLSRAPGAAHVTPDCFALYRRHFYGWDAMTPLAMRLEGEAQAEAPLIALRLRSLDVPCAQWREAIYDRSRLCDRLTLLYAPAARAVYAINLYRSVASGAFGAGEIERGLDVAPLLRRVHRNALGSEAQHRSTSERLSHAEQSLTVRAPRLSPRERQVCARIAVGLTVDGIGADLGVAPSTVVTLRKRAYAKLGVNCRVAMARLAC